MFHSFLYFFFSFLISSKSSSFFSVVNFFCCNFVGFFGRLLSSLKTKVGRQNGAIYFGSFMVVVVAASVFLLTLTQLIDFEDNDATNDNSVVVVELRGILDETRNLHVSFAFEPYYFVFFFFFYSAKKSTSITQFFFCDWNEHFFYGFSLLHHNTDVTANLRNIQSLKKNCIISMVSLLFKKHEENKAIK